MHKNTAISEVKAAIQIALFKPRAMLNVASDKHNTAYTYGIIAVASLLGALGQYFFMPIIKISLLSVLGIAVVSFVNTIIGIYAFSFVAKSLFKGSANHEAYFRTAAYASILGWLMILPILGIVVTIWGLVLAVAILKVVHKLSTGAAIGSFLVGLIVLMLVSMILAPIYGFLALSGSSSRTFDLSIFDREGFLNFGEDKFELNVEGENGGSVNLEDGKMTIKTEDGQEVNINIPSTNE